MNIIVEVARDRLSTQIVMVSEPASGPTAAARSSKKRLIVRPHADSGKREAKTTTGAANSYNLVTSMDSGEITRLLHAWRQGDQAALEQLVPLVSRELRRLARGYMRREQPGATLQTTALINEAYLKLMESQAPNWANRSHFFAVAAQVMRRILVDRARARMAEKRGGQAVRVDLDEIPDFGPERDRELIQLDDSLKRLAASEPRKARVVELRFFGGLSVDQTAEVLEVSPQTVLRDWRLARAWLFDDMKQK
jgi:RNA polymerase sigma factor (TIGR02999 family)